MINYFDRLISQIRSFHKDNKSLQESINKILQDEILDPKKVIKKDGFFLQNTIIQMLLKLIQSLNGNKLNIFRILS